MIRVSGLSLSYSGHERELEDVNLAIAGGEFICLVGPSGCGKSSLLRIIAGVLPPLRGQVELDSRPVTSRRSEIGFMPQDGLLLPWRTALANVALPLELSGETPAAAKKRARALLELVGADALAARYPQSLSGGEKQRIALARALAGEHSVLLLDEPFASLDAITREELNLLLQEVWLRTKSTILMVTHNIFEAVLLADRVLVMAEKPGTLLGEVRIGLPRPRTLAEMSRADFAALAGKVRTLLAQGGESVAQACSLG